MVFMGLLVMVIYGLIVRYVGIRLMSVLLIKKEHTTAWLRRLFWLIYLTLSLLFLLTFLLPEIPVKRALYITASYFQGFFAYLLFLYLVEDIGFFLVRVIRKKKKSVRVKGRQYAYAVATVLSLMLVFYGAVHAREVKTISYEVDMEKSAGKMTDLKVVMVSDVHLRYVVGLKDIEKMVEGINKLEPDIVIIAGDFFDDNIKAVSDQEEILKEMRSISSRYGTYAVLGNHDAGDTYPEMLDFFRQAGVILLQDEHILIKESFLLVGRKDERPIGYQGGERVGMDELLQGTGNQLPLIMVDHQPTALDEADELGVDLLLGGHTHKGQIFPGRLLTRLIFRNDWGYLKAGDFVSIVSGGFGTWGPPMPIGTDAEIVEIKIEFGN